MLSMLYSWNSKAPARVPTDRVIPLGFMDDDKFHNNIGSCNMHVFDDVLCPQKLRSSLELLISKKTWQKIGGRLRQNTQGGFEYHIPKEFTTDRPAIAFSHVDYSSIRKIDHPLASKIPKPSAYPKAVCTLEDYEDLALGADCPTCINDYLYSDQPLLGLHVVSFKDATLVTIRWLHVMFDGMGLGVLMKSWVLAMQGKEVPELEGFGYDPFVSLGKNPTENHKLADQRLPVISLLLFCLKLIISNMFGKFEQRMVCIPSEFLDRLRANALHELTVAGITEPFVSENDVIMAWWTRLSLSRLPASRKSVAASVAMSLRQVLGGDLMSSGKPRQYTSNCYSFYNVVIPANHYNESIGDIALRMRSALNQQRSRGQVEAYQALVRRGTGKLPVLFGTSDMQRLVYSNWSSANLFGLDFAAAAVQPRETPLCPSYISVHVIRIKYSEAFCVVGKDSSGNTWIFGSRTPALWDKIEEELESLKDTSYGHVSHDGLDKS